MTNIRSYIFWSAVNAVSWFLIFSNLLQRVAK
jgi:hypothetical protein